ncbi:S41 family peptidase [Flaviramulus sp. BrNp1-15]|uniref:S41 family peptidase n=1 Tax=Flaviramulus sp. BrNp1-15 TaxID=2916754 RepID=UPI001EE78E63|nr:S41 family peptidase [Flaviramulus sp. BrNp1-15]ULC58856.1 S41 family peptidase [Flaviramulus sp. BrNp1-15]
MKNLKTLILLFISITTLSCFEDNDDNLITASEINDFVWKGMNVFYLYKDEIPNLANDRFSSNTEYADYLNSFDDPFDLFESLIYDRQNVDRFSWIVDDYIALEQFFDGISTSNGMEFQIFRFSTTDTNRYGIVTHVLPNTDAELNGVKRGDIFYGIDGTTLNSNNVSSLLNQNSYTINLGSYDDNGTPETSDDSVTPGSESITLSKSAYTENPILINRVLDIESNKIAYLMYNGFTGTDQFNNELNDVFGTFKSANATELVLDLRYNPGGSVYTAIILSSLITGQFTGDVFSTEQWNTEFQEAYQNEDPELLINRFINNNDGAALNSLNLSKVYILTTRSSASASELVINSLRPYIDVVQIGTTTSGKYQASTTLYDSSNFRRQGANPRHTYAMQPLIYKSLNVNGITDYFNGLTPNIVLGEQINNLGVLGDESEPLLAEAIANITGTGKASRGKIDYVDITNDSNDFIPFSKGMYVDKELPENLIKDILFK